ncbi:MAG: DUF3108 domain-containing protein [Terricaulis sp.]
MRAVLLALLISLTAAMPAAADRFLLRYDGNGLGFIPLGGMTVDADVDDASYTINVTLASGGMLNFFERTNLEATSSGAIDGNVVHWRQYALDHHYSRKHRTIAMSVGNDGAVIAAINPTYRIWGDPAATDAQRRAARDPLSTMVAMSIDAGATRRCGGGYLTFDGRFLYRLELTGGRIGHFFGGGYSGDVLKCSLAYVPVAGFERRDGGYRQVRNGQVWFALAPGARYAPPVLISTPLSAGASVIRLNHWHRATVTVEVEPAPPATAPPITQ